MKKYLDHPIFVLNQKSYLSLVIILMPMLNFLGGMNIDIYAPSMPAIAVHFGVGIALIKNTIAVTVLGWVFGSLFFGSVMDSIGRKRTLIYAMLLYLLFTGLVFCCQSITQLMIIRFLQGFTLIAMGVGCRTLIMDNFIGHRYNVAIIYTSIGYGLGPVIAPFIGGILQQYFGWQASFVLIFFVATFLLLIVIIFIKESLPSKQSLQLRAILKNYGSILSHRKFITGAFILGMMQIQMLIYPTMGPFLVENVLHRNPIVYGNTALIVGAGYLMGNLLNRVLVKFISLNTACYIGYSTLLLGVIFSFVFSLYFRINLPTLLIPIVLINIGCGFIVANIMGTNLKQFPNNAGLTMAIQISLLALITTVGLFISNYVEITALLQLTIIYFVLVVLAAIAFIGSYQTLLK